MKLGSDNGSASSTARYIVGPEKMA